MASRCAWVGACDKAGIAVATIAAASNAENVAARVNVVII
jgi:hypothetical protein